MLVFIDESGDPGFRLDRGSSKVFVTSMVLFGDPRQAALTDRKIRQLRERLNVNPEFKFNKCKSGYRDEFFREVAGCGFSARFVVVQKELIHSAALKAKKESFYKFFIKMMMKYDGGMLRDAKVIIDGSGDRPFKKQFKAYIRKNVPPDCVREVHLRDSADDPLVQLADMTAGAIARSYNAERKDKDRWRDMLNRNGQISNVWEFR